ncbi:hypothetical protein RN001_002068 [Aquatica leii]|uniref:Regulatory protein zeste n=1 Tax=Aquatica leii TaxID=1421715 RepID=A0AAN7SJX4_9COLE|nr:hypothetical protein RN001_002068 [Aquatica leii]
MEKKRNRGTNFSKEEELLLLVEVEKLKNIIENKQSDKLHSSEKSEAWITVANNFNAINCIARSQDQLKIKYENLKMKARKFAADQRFCQGTGGGPPNINIKDPVLDAVLRIINFKTVVGLINPFDIDSIRNNAQNKENILPVTVYKAKSVTEDLDYEISQSLLVLEEPQVCTTISKVCTPSASKVMEVDLENKENQHEVTFEQNNANWSKYTPKKLKTPISKKLKQKMQNEKVQRRILRDTSNSSHMREIDFQKVFRLSRDGVHHLVEVLGPHLVSGERSNALSVELKIFSALAFFASGCYQKSIAQHFNLAVEQSRLSRIIAEVTDSMVTNLLGHYIKFPESPAELQAVKAGFYEKYNFPGVIGAIDCSHVAIIAPKTNDPHRPGIAYYNRKGFYSLNVQVICDAHMKILNSIQQNLLPLEVANEDNEIDIVQDNQVNPNYLHEGRRIQREIINTYFNDQH